MSRVDEFTSNLPDVGGLTWALQFTRPIKLKTTVVVNDKHSKKEIDIEVRLNFVH